MQYAIINKTTHEMRGIETYDRLIDWMTEHNDMIHDVDYYELGPDFDGPITEFVMEWWHEELPRLLEGGFDVWE